MVRLDYYDSCCRPLPALLYEEPIQTLGPQAHCLPSMPLIAPAPRAKERADRISSSSAAATTTADLQTPRGSARCTTTDPGKKQQCRRRRERGRHEEASEWLRPSL